MNEAVRPVAGACGRAEGECCYPLHQAVQAFAGEREAASVVGVVVAFVAGQPGCSARAVYTGLRAQHTRRQVLAALQVGVRQGALVVDRTEPRRHRYAVGPVTLDRREGRS